MHISTNVQFWLKKPDKEYRGVTNESWNFCKKKKVDYKFHAMHIIMKLLDFYLETGMITGSDAKEELSELSEMITDIKLVQPELEENKR